MNDYHQRFRERFGYAGSSGTFTGLRDDAILAFIDEVVTEQSQETKPAKQHAADMEKCWCQRHQPKHQGFCEMDADHSGPCRTEYEEARHLERTTLIAKTGVMKVRRNAWNDPTREDAYNQALDDILTYLRGEDKVEVKTYLTNWEITKITANGVELANSDFFVNGGSVYLYPPQREDNQLPEEQ